MATNQDQDFHGCYFPDGSKAYNHTACNAAAGQSACCPNNFACLDNGYCLQTTYPWSNRLGRSSCTDQTFNNNACPQMCKDVRPSNSIGLYLAYDTPGGAFCCGVNVDTATGLCQNGTLGSNKPFDLADGNVIYNRSSGAIMNVGQVTLANLTAAGVIPSSNGTTSLPASEVSTSSPATSTVSSGSNIVPVAVGIAVPLAVLLIAALIACGVLFSQNRRLRQEKKSYMNQVYAPLMESKDVSKDGAMATATVNEHKTPSTQVNAWTGPPSQPAHYYESTATPRSHLVEAGSMHLGELPSNEIPRSEK